MYQRNRNFIKMYQRKTNVILVPFFLSRSSSKPRPKPSECVRPENAVCKEWGTKKKSELERNH